MPRLSYRQLPVVDEMIEGVARLVILPAAAEIFYRRQRTQARLGYLSPAAFERQYYENRLAA
jgi:hypothetical protein